MAMESKVISITPYMAKEMLERNMTRNRRIDNATVQRYARIMRSGGWNLTHQGIAFDENGTLIDGQHRLNAVVAVNIPVTMMVTYNVEHHTGEAFTIDAGRKRTTGNILQISGIDDVVYKHMYPYIACYLRWKAVPGRKADPVELIAYIERHYSDMVSVFNIVRPDYCGGKGHVFKIPAIVGAAMIAALYRGEDYDALEKFCKVYRFNDVSNCENYNARHALNLREYVRDHKYSADVYNRCESSIYAFANNRACLHVRNNIYPFNGSMDA